MAKSLQPQLGTGWAFPVRPTNGSLQLVSDEVDVEQAIGLVLETTQRERVMQPGFGSTLRDRVFDSNTPALSSRIEQDVTNALATQEPRIQVQRVSAYPATVQPHVLLIDIDYVIRQTNAFYNLVYPFYLTEGA